MICVIIPVHNEEELLPACLVSVNAAARDPLLADEKVLTVVVLDACTDGSAEVAGEYGAQMVQSHARNVGAARASGAAVGLRAGARWLAFTDGDTVVPEDWLSRQLACKSDVVCGIVSIDGWSQHAPEVEKKFQARYQDRDGHRHIHGANLGIRAAAYRRVGGFSPLALHEDVAIVQALEAAGASVAWVAEPCVQTNSRPVGRLTGGFACYLRGLQESELV